MASFTSSASIILVTALLLCTQLTLVLSTEGLFFFLAFMNPSPTRPNNGIQEIHVSGSKDVDTKVRIQVLSQNQTYMYQLNSTNNWGRTLTIYPDLAGPSGTRLPISVVVSSEKPISVQANKAEDGTAGGYLALPITAESMSYYVASYTPRGPSQGFSIASPFHTCVTVYKENGPEQIRELDVSLNPGQVFHVNSTGDLTGRHVTSNRPIAVFSGLDCAYVAADTQSVQKCDHIVEQLHPVSEFGKVFVASSFHLRNPSSGFQIRVVGTIRTTVSWAEIEYDPATNTPKAAVVKPTATITRGNFVELAAGRGNKNPVVVMLTCSASCLVMQYGESNDMPSQGGENGVKPDSAMITVPGINHYTSDITFSTSKLYSASGNQTLDNVNGLTVIAKKSDVPQLMLDGQPLTSALPGAKQIDFTFPSALNVAGVTAPPDTYTVVYGGAIMPGFHKVTHSDPNARYTVMVYGHSPSSSSSDSEGYAYLGGMRYQPATIVPDFPGTYFDFSPPASETPIGQPQNPGTPTGPTEPVIPTEFPSHESIWEAPFYIVNPHLQDLKTRNCSEAYERYYLEQRLAPMKVKVSQKVKAECASSVNVTLVHMQYYSQFTSGMIRFRLSVTATGAVSLADMYDCAGRMGDFVSDIKNWVPDYVDETSFLRPDAYYNRGCDPLHTDLPPVFYSYYFGWNCAYKGGKLGASDATTAKAPALFVALLAVVSAILQLRR